MEIIGVPEIELLWTGGRAHLFFERDGSPKYYKNSWGKVRQPKTKTLEWVLECEDEKFLDFLKKCFVWNPEEWISPQQALRHEWILDGLPPNIIVHHMNLHGIKDSELPRHIWTKVI